MDSQASLLVVDTQTFQLAEDNQESVDLDIEADSKVDLGATGKSENKTCHEFGEADNFKI